MFFISHKEAADQLALPIPHDEQSLKRYLENALGKEISLTITDNSTSMLSVKVKGMSVYIRLHRIFLAAGDDVIKEISEFIKNRRLKTPRIRAFIRQHAGCLPQKPSRRLNMRTEGKFYDLRPIYDTINEEYFDGRVSALITWGAKSSRYAVRKRTLGSYSSHSHMIRINPVLDKKTVPSYFVEFVVYHEMLHADMGTEKRNGRRTVHSREFKRRERLFKDYEKAMAWEKRGG